jgi:hypothetical protein
MTVADNSWWDSVPEEPSQAAQADNSWWDTIPEENNVVPTKSFGDTALQGLADVPQGLARTAERTIGPGVISETLNAAAQLPLQAQSGEPAYEPEKAPPLENTWSSVGQNLSHYGKAALKGIIRSTPGFITDAAPAATGAMLGAVLGPVGALVGGTVGAGLGYTARNFGKDLDRLQDSGGTTGADPGLADVAKVAAADMTMGALNRFGLRGGSILKSTGLNAAGQGASSIIDQAAMEGKVDPARVAQDMAIGGTIGGLGHAATKVPLNPLPNMGLRNEIVGKAGRIGLDMAKEDPSGTIAKVLSNVVRDNVDIDTNKGASKALQYAYENMRSDPRNSSLPSGVRQALDQGRPLQPSVISQLPQEAQQFAKARTVLADVLEKTKVASPGQMNTIEGNIAGNIGAIVAGHPAPFHLVKSTDTLIRKFTAPGAKKVLKFYQQGQGTKIKPENASGPDLFSEVQSDGTGHSAELKTQDKGPSSVEHAVRGPAESFGNSDIIRNAGAYAKAVARRKELRSAVYDDLKSQVSPKNHSAIDSLHDFLDNNSVRSPTVAKEHIRLTLKDMSKADRIKAKRALMSQKFLSTFVSGGK